MIGVLVFPDFQLLDAAGPISVFEIAARFAGSSPSIRVLAETPGPVRSSSGVEMLARGLKPAGAITTLIVAGGEGVDAAAKCDEDAGLRAGHGQARRPRRQRLLRRLYPRRSRPARWPPRHHALAAHPAFPRRLSQGEAGARPDFRPRRQYLELRPGSPPASIWRWRWSTEDFGEEVARQTARQLVLYHRRSGGQSQFSSLLELKAPTGRFGPLLTWAREHLDAPLTVEDLAEQAGMSSRHFTRAFIAETGTTPSKAVERLRIEVARQRVQSSGEAIERVAQQTGFRDPERMRRAFIRAFGQPPQSLRRAARAAVTLRT